jgi:hypothetical protein
VNSTARKMPVIRDIVGENIVMKVHGGTHVPSS